VELSLEEARNFKQKLIEEVYPELSQYLYENLMHNLARNLRKPVRECKEKLSWSGRGDIPSGVGMGIGIRNVIRGKQTRKDSTPYSPAFVEKVWKGLHSLNKNEEIAGLIDKAAERSKRLTEKSGTELDDGADVNTTLYERLFNCPSITLTGRMRGSVNFTQARNTPFSGLAADGAKLAVWNLTHVGFRIVCFVHDEIVLEIPYAVGDTQTGNRVTDIDLHNPDLLRKLGMIDKVMCSSMQEVCGPVPISCSISVARNWSKKGGYVWQKEEINQQR